MAEEVIHRMVKRAVEMEGTVTGEHGVGLIKRDYLEHEVGESTVDAMRRVSPTMTLFSKPMNPSGINHICRSVWSLRTDDNNLLPVKTCI